ncbi:hypothetical protein [Candidatus Phytoplasma solani]|uniref:hypothetical protein n=1 Tax=Candidatus Phytoplasma solani TaxID=69896 RepID=UPI00358E63A8
MKKETKTLWQKLNKLINKNKLITILAMTFTILVIITIIVFNEVSETSTENDFPNNVNNVEKPNNLQKPNQNSNSSSGVVEVDVLPSSNPNAALIATNKVLETELTQQKQQNQQQTIMLQESQAAKQYLQQKQTQYTQIVAALVQKMNTTTQNKKDLQNQIDDYQKQINEFKDKEAKITQLEETIQSLTQTLEQNKNQEKEINELKQTISQLQTELQNYKDKDNQLSEAISQGNAIIENLKNELTAKNNELTTKTQELETKTTALNDATTAKVEAETKLETTKNELTTKTQELETKTKALNDATTAKLAAETKLETTKNELTTKTQELETKTITQNELTAKIATMAPSNEKTELEGELNKLQNEKTQLEQDKNNLEAAKNTAQSELETKTTALNDATTAKVEAETKLETTKNELTTKTQELETKTKALNDATTAKLAAETKLETTKNELTTKTQELETKTITTLIQKYPYLKNCHCFNELQKSPTQKQSLLLEPYLTYQTHEGDIIREYRLFEGMQPQGKDHTGQTNYFERKDFDEIMNKYELTSFPTRWTNGRENLYNLEYENGKLKPKHDWIVSKANYNLIQTNQPNNTPRMMTKDIEGANGFWNKSICFSHGCDNKDLKNLLYFENDKTPYIRFLTKNLEVEFDWLTLIVCEFKEFMPLTAEAQKNTARAQQYTAEAQENTALAQQYTAKVQEFTPWAKCNTSFARQYPAEAQENTARALEFAAWAQKNTAWAQENTVKAKISTGKAQYTINQLQSTKEPKNITINLTEKTVNDYSKPNSTKQVPYFELSYDLDELVNFINELDLCNNPHLRKIRNFVNEYAKPQKPPRG